MSDYIKFPRIPHLPWSAGGTEDDIYLIQIESMREIVVTEKMDGENSSLYCDHLHARSVTSSQHSSRSWLKNLWAQIKHNIPKGMIICGENLYAVHSIYYSNLPSYFMVFAVFDGNECLSWNDTIEWATLLGLETVPVLYDGKWDENCIKKCYTKKSKYGDIQEGYVVRSKNSFQRNDFIKHVSKYVRFGHVQTDMHWMEKQIVLNGLKNKNSSNKTNYVY